MSLKHLKCRPCPNAEVVGAHLWNSAFQDVATYIGLFLAIRSGYWYLRTACIKWRFQHYAPAEIL